MDQGVPKAGLGHDNYLYWTPSRMRLGMQFGSSGSLGISFDALGLEGPTLEEGALGRTLAPRGDPKTKTKAISQGKGTTTSWEIFD